MPSSELLEIMGPALAAGLMIALTHAPLGLEVYRRGIIFIDLAIAQAAGLGFVTAGLLREDPPWLLVQPLALGFALLAAILFRWVEKKLPGEQEAVIGSAFVLSASLAVLLLAGTPHGGEELEHLLSGQILFVTWRDMLIHAPVYILILSVWFAAPGIRKTFWFYILFAVAITSSVQLVGVYVVFASLILPAIAVARNQRKQALAWGMGLLSVTTGIILSTICDFPAGPVIVLSYAVMAVAWRCMFLLRSGRRLG